MSGPVFFAVERTPTGEQAAIHYDRMPARLTGKNAQRDGLVYAVRMDTLPNGHLWMKMSLGELFAAFKKARAGNVPLPNNIAPPPQKTGDPARAKIGHREVARHQGTDLPPEPFPTVEELDRRAAERDARS